MKLRAALIASKGPPGIFLMDQNDTAVISISVVWMGPQGSPETRKTTEQVAAAIADLIPEEGIDV